MPSPALVRLRARADETHACDVEAAWAGRGEDGRNAAVPSPRRWWSAAISARDVGGAGEGLPTRDGGLAIPCLFLAVLRDAKMDYQLEAPRWFEVWREQIGLTSRRKAGRPNSWPSFSSVMARRASSGELYSTTLRKGGMSAGRSRHACKRAWLCWNPPAALGHAVGQGDDL